MNNDIVNKAKQAIDKHDTQREMKIESAVDMLDNISADSELNKKIEKKYKSRTTTIRMRIIRVGLVSLLSGVIVCATLSLGIIKASTSSNALTELSSLADAYASAVSNADIIGNKNFVNDLFVDFNSDNENEVFGFIVNGEGTVFCETNNEYITKDLCIADLAEDEDYAELSALITEVHDDVELKRGTEKIKLCGKKYLLAYSIIENYNGFYTILMKPYSTVTKTFYFALKIMIAAAAVLFVCSFAICTKVSSLISKPIIEVSDRLKKLSEGDLGSPTPVADRKDETRVLVTALEDTITSLRRYIGDIKAVLSEVSGGNLLAASNTEYRGDFTSIKDSLNMILDSLNGTFFEVDTAAKQVKECSVQVSEGAETLSNNASNEASAIEELTASVSEISVKIDENAKQAIYASGLTKEADVQVGESSKAMSDMLEAIGELESSSAQIAKIINTIDDIAFQTNILALNAAVEAARAGAAGKGFAVVADEVRNLATKSAEAANQTGTLINKSLAAVKKSTALASKTSSALDQVVKKVRSVSGIVDGIADSTKEQAEAVSQVNIGMENINSSIQTTSSTAEESAAASEELSGQSDMLNDMINKFTFRKAEI